VKDQKVSKHDLDIVFSEQVCDILRRNFITSMGWGDKGRDAYLVVGKGVLTGPRRPSQ
jgi:hypothetical protein